MCVQRKKVEGNIRRREKKKAIEEEWGKRLLPSTPKT